MIAHSHPSEVTQVDSLIDSLFDRYERGGMTRRHLVQALVALALPTSVLAQDAAPAPIVRGLSVNHVQIAVSDLERSTDFYQRLFGVTKGWPTINAATGIHLDLPNGYISISLDAAGDKKGAIGHFSVGIDRLDAATAKDIEAKINSQMPDAKAKANFQQNDGVWVVNLNDPDGTRVQISSKDGR